MVKKHYFFIFLFLFAFFNQEISASFSTRTGWWKFDNANSLTLPENGYAASLTLVGNHVAVAGPEESNGAILIGIGSYYEINHHISPKGGGSKINEYSIQIDFKIPANGVWYSFFQTNVANNDDAELFINPSGKIGVAAVGYSNFSIVPEEWYRLVITVKNGVEFNYYIDGNLILSGTAQAVDGRFSLGEKLLIFADNDREDGDIYCSELAIWDKSLTASEVKELASCTLNPAYLSTRIPYLQSPGQTNMTVCWHDTATVQTQVVYGIDSLSLNLATAGSSEIISLPYRWHTVKLINLNADCRYYYRVMSGGNASQIYSFKTLPLNNSTEKVRFLILGDTHCSDTTMAGKVLRAAKAKMIEKFGWNFNDSVRAILHTGDIVVSGSSPEQYTKQFFKPLSSVTPYMPTLVVAGNHEAENANFYNYLKLNDLSVFPESANLNEKIWQLRTANSLFIGLNTNIYEQYGTTQANWLNERLREAESDSNIDFIFLFFHHPPFSELWAYVNSQDGGSNYVKNSLLPVIKKYTKVKEIHYGHTHGFERGTLMSNNQDGDFRIICGGGSGGFLDPWAAGENEDLNDIHKTISEYCYQILEIDPNNASYANTAYSLGTLSHPKNSEVLDSWYISKNQKTPQKPTINKVMFVDNKLQVESSEFEGEDSIMSKHIQFYSANNVTVLDTVIHKQNIYGVDALTNPVDLNKNIDFYESNLNPTQLTNNNQYLVRVRYRDNNLKWSEWSDNYSFSVSGFSAVVANNEQLQIYPNPFTSYATIKYSVNEITDIALNIYTIDHRLIYSYKQQNQPNGQYFINFNPTNMSTGVYLCKLTTNRSSETIKIIKSK
jgi:hypothetical protein